MVFCSDQSTGFLTAAGYKLCIDGLPGKHIHHTGGNALQSQRRGGFQCFGDHDAAGNDGHIRAVAQDIALADLKGAAGLVDPNGIFPGHAGIVNTVGICQLAGKVCQGNGIAGLQKRDLRYCSEYSHIFKRHMGTAVIRSSDAGIRAGDPDVQFRVGC